MTWREAFLRQARSDEYVRQLLIRERVAYAQQLHYLQMVTEKLAKGLYLDDADADPPPTSHVAFVRLLQTLRGRPDVRKWLGFRGAAAFEQFIASLLPLARRIEQLAPSVAGLASPNPEYPWRDQASGTVRAPSDHTFTELRPTGAQMIKLERLLRDLLRSNE